jgi:hypothetical protein
LNPALEELIYLIRSVIPFDPDPSLFGVSRDLAIFIMSCDPMPPTIILTRDPHSFPAARDPLTSQFPVARNISLSRWIVVTLRCWRDKDRRWRQSG